MTRSTKWLGTTNCINFREFLQKVYDLGDTRQKVDIAELSDDQVRTLIKNLRGGLPRLLLLCSTVLQKR